MYDSDGVGRPCKSGVKRKFQKKTVRRYLRACESERRAKVSGPKLKIEQVKIAQNKHT